MADSTTDEVSLKALIEKHRELSIESLLPEELNILINSFLPFQRPSIRAQSLLFLSKFSSDIRQKYSSQSDPDVATSVLIRAFSAPIEVRLAGTYEADSLSALSFLSALFQVDWASATAIFLRDGLLDSIFEVPDLYPSSETMPVAVANLLSQASGHKQCRPLIAAPQAKAWLIKSMKQTKNSALCAAAAVALIKHSQGSEVDAQSSDLAGVSVTEKLSEREESGIDDSLVAMMKTLVIAKGPPSSSMLDAVEGLAYLTVQPSVKEIISTDPNFLKRFMSLVPHPSAPSFPASHANRSVESSTTAQDPDLGLSYGIAVIINNLCAYKPRLSDEEQQIERLRRMTRQPSTGGKLSADVKDSSAVDKLDDDEHVRARGKRLVDSGVVDALSSIVKRLWGGQNEKKSITTLRTVAKSFLSLVEDKANRGSILQGGGSKALLTVIRASIIDLPLKSDDHYGIDGLEPADLLAMQALAKLSITSPPAAVFGPTQDAYVDAIRPFTILLMHSSSSLLQRFEAAMALTNIASVTPEAAERVSAFQLQTGKIQGDKTPVGDIVKCTESLLLDGNTMLRRAAVELVCNLVGGAEGSFDYFGGAASGRAKSKLQILVALSDVEDLPTRLAASGALAALTASPHACQSLAKLEMERHRVLPIFVDLISPEIAQEYREERPESEDTATAGDGFAGDPGLVHRGVVCVRNLFANLDGREERQRMSLEAEKRGLVRALIHIIKSNSGGPASQPVLRSAAEVLKWIVQSGIKLPL